MPQGIIVIGGIGEAEFSFTDMGVRTRPFTITQAQPQVRAILFAVAERTCFVLAYACEKRHRRCHLIYVKTKTLTGLVFDMHHYIGDGL